MVNHPNRGRKSKLSKKAIRAALAPLSRGLLNGADSQWVDLMGFQIECLPLNTARGCAGFAWHPHFTVYENGKVKTGGSLTEVVDRLAILQPEAHPHRRPQFRQDNTSGFTDAELAEMNTEFNALMHQFEVCDVPDDLRGQVEKDLATEVLRKHGAA